MEKTTLSIIIPCKNEGSNIARLLDSIIKIPLFNKSEVILVDCDSNDNTISIAAKYPIKILRLRSTSLYSPSAARYIGAKFSSGDFILFIDSDMALEPGFLEKALDILNKDRSIAGVSGIGKEIYLKNGEKVGEKPNLYNRKNKVALATFLGGAGLYRKSALLEAGGFNPFLMASEENDLAQRLRKKKYKLLSIPVPMIIHYTAPLSEWEEFMRKRKLYRFIGIGEAIRKSHSFKYLIESLIYHKEFTFFLIYLIFACGLTVFLYPSSAFKYLYLPLAPLVIIYIYLALRKKSFVNGFLSFIKWFIISMDIMRGLTMPPKNPDTYQANTEIIKGEFDVQR